MRNKEKSCPYKIIDNDEPTCKSSECLCFIKDFKDCTLYRSLKRERKKKFNN